MRKRILSCILAVCMIFSLLPVSALADESAESGACGENVTWTLKDGTLTISGEGKMTDYDSEGTPWYDKADVITSVIIESGVTSIGNSAFEGCRNLTSIEIPDGVTHIGYYAFSGCSSLETITIPESVTSIGDWAFVGCSSLISIDVDGSNETYCSDNGVLFDKGKTVIVVYPAGMAAKEYRIPDSVKSIGNAAFSACSNLTNITIPAGVTSIGDCAFGNCTGLTSITIPDSVTSIGYSVFDGCSSLTSITIPAGVTSIGDWAFGNCTGLTSIIIPSSVTSIGECAFYECNSLADVNYLGTTEQWGGITISKGNTCLKEATIYCTDGNIEPLKYCGENVIWTLEDGILTISGEGEMNNYGTLDVGENDYVTTAPWGEYYESIKSVVIKDGVTSIGEDAFYGCAALTSVTIPNSVTRIDWEAFGGCTGLTSVIIPAGVTNIGHYVFSGCSSLETITLSESVTSIGDSAFHGCSSLTSITIPESVTSIGDGVFVDCSSLISIDVDESNETYCSYNGVLFDKGKTVIVVYPAGMEAKEYRIPDSVKSVGNAAFCACSILTSITIPAGVTSIGDWAFGNCTGLTSITIPDSVTSIGECALYECSSLTSITIPAGVTSIEDWLVGWCSSLTSITIPDSVTSIGGYAFCECNNLSDISYDGTKEQWGSIEISEGNGCLTACTIHCTDGDIYPRGECGENVTWTLKDGTLTISGEGAMYDYNDEDRIPWYGKSESITKLVIEDGVTRIGYYAFYGCINLTDVTIPDSVTRIGFSAFGGCTSMTEANYSGTLEQWLGIEIYGENGCLERANIHCANGDIGVAWELADGVLTIFGNGFMPDYGYMNAPWMDERESITSIVVEDGATRIGDCAFEVCRNVKSITLPASITYIGYYALPSADEPLDIYYGGTKAQWDEIDIVSGELMMNSAVIHCTDGDVLASDYCGNHVKWTLENGVLTISGAGKMYSYEDGQYPPWGSRVEEITSIVIENGVTGIGTYAFAGCKNAKSISIAESVEKIGYGAFMNCDALKNVVLPEGLVTAESSIFSGCDSLESVTVPSTVTDGVIGWFGYCPNLKNIIVDERSDSFASVDGVLFNKYMTQILLYPEGREAESYQIPEGVTFIGDCAFDNCNNLKYIGIPDNVTEIGEDAFSGCTGLTSITLPDGVMSLGEYAFSGCTGLTNIILPDRLMEIADSTFKNCTGLKSIVIPDSVMSIGLSAFRDCSSLTSVTISNSVARIDSWAFANCSNLTSLVIPNNVSYIGNNAFTGCSALESLTLPNCYASIASEAFSGCTSLRTVTIPKTVSFDGNIFSGCTSLEAINVEEGHNDCHSEDGVVYSVDFYSSEANLKIYPSAKQNEKFDIPEWVGCISDYAFDNCSKLKTLTIPGGVSHISNRAFFDCYSLSGFIVSEENPNYSSQDGVLFDKDKTALIVYPLGRDCVEYAIPESVSRIDAYAFWNCNSIQAISIPDSVSVIGDGAFAWSSLAYVNYSGTVEQWNEILIGSDNHGLRGAVIHCNDGDIYPHGSYGENLTFELRDGTLTISGTGDVVECYEIPWYGYKHKITNVVIENGVTGIGGMAFYNCMNLQSVTIADTVTGIGDGAFEGCTSLENVYYGGTAEQWAKIVICSSNDALANAEITYTASHTHSYTDTVTAPTCTEQGYTTHTCTCGDSYVDSYVDATGHSFGAWTQTKAPTCTESGTESRTCANCGKTETREIAALDHNLVHHDGKAATCTEVGWEAYDTCSRCDYTTYKEIAATGHHYTAKVVAPTCTVKGHTIYTCTCGDSYISDYVDALGHDRVHHDGKAATCTEKGWAAYDTCSRCGYSTYKEIAATGHHYADTVTAPTCTANGYTTHACACGNSYVDSYTNALGHSYKNGICTRCNAKSPSYVAAPVIKITTSAGKPKISWSAVDGATKYYVYRSTDGKTYKQYTTTTKTSYADSNAKIGTTYYYKVKAAKVVNSKTVYSAYSNVKSIKCTPAAPVVSISRSNGKPKLTWKAVTGASKYYIYRSTDGKTYKQYTTTTKTSYTNTGAASGKKYYYKVKAVAVVNKKNVFSAYSTAKNLMTTLATPTVSITTANGKPKITWKAVTGADKYIVYRSTDGKTFKQLSTTTKTSLTNTGAKKNTKYYYKVKAVCTKNTSANSALSKVVSIKATK